MLLLGFLIDRRAKMNTRKRVEWCNLPKDLLIVISERLDNRLDVLRFRAICRSWRSSLGPFDHNSPPFPIYLPNLMTSIQSRSYFETYLKETTIYRLEPLHQDKDNSNDTESSSSSSKGWLMEVEEWKPGCYHLLNPLSHHKIRYKPEKFRKKLNLLDYRVFELCKGYRLDHGAHVGVHKAIFSADDSTVLVICNDGNLAFLRLGDEKWTPLDKSWGTSYTDIMLYKGKFHAIDNCGQVVVIDSSTLTVTEVWPQLRTLGSKKQFVQSSEDFYVIATYNSYDWMGYKVDNLLKFQIYKLDEAGWVEVKSLEDRVVFLGEDCSFFASAEQLARCKRNCIYFSPGENNGWSTRVLNLLDRTTSQLSSPTNSQVFWPPPAWLREAKKLPLNYGKKCQAALRLKNAASTLGKLCEEAYVEVNSD